jgi:hypothetical protein
MVTQRTDDDLETPSADAIYPVEDNSIEIAPAEIRDWLSLRRDLIDIWRVSYEEFAQEFVRHNACVLDWKEL